MDAKNNIQKVKTTKNLAIIIQENQYSMILRRVGLVVKKIVYDWDEFTKIPTCAVGTHINVNQHTGGEFYKSNTVANAQKALDKDQNRQKIVVQDINEYNKKCDELKKQQQQQTQPEEKKPFVTEEGKYKCINKGCNKDYSKEENSEKACCFHPGQPIFHDLKKEWSCCQANSYEWDEFMKLPTCKVGMHSPRLI
eukprot:TRINITY_DN113_c0_g2_i1.p2 TRINITY_DN113_c0_g2~~TRINITY_DN113_c0_g2_i1.p2  ORF type:complete len:195 (+),score=42.13 TRINITY_DN113_c0_g2_i1:93-677(+)